MASFGLISDVTDLHKKLLQGPVTNSRAFVRSAVAMARKTEVSIPCVLPRNSPF